MHRALDGAWPPRAVDLTRHLADLPHKSPNRQSQVQGVPTDDYFGVRHDPVVGFCAPCGVGEVPDLESGGDAVSQQLVHIDVGMRGTLVMSTDPETQALLESLIRRGRPG